MRVLLSFGKNGGRGAWLLATLLLLALGWLRPQAAQASHIRAGDIQAKVDTINGNPNRIFFRLTLYRDIAGVDQPTVTMYFGDGNRLDNIPKATTLRVGQTDIFTYYCEHTYSGSATYTVSFVGQNRNTGVINIYNSDQQSFYVSTVISVTPAYGRNHSPVLRAPAVDQGAVGQVFLHNPAGYDADGDSLSYHLIECRQVNGGADASNVTNKPIPVICTNYVYPDNQGLAPGAKQVPFSGIPAGIPANNAIIVQDVNTGQITWNAPARAGIYNIAFQVDEIRRTANGFRTIGNVVRDMQIIIQPSDNLPPTLIVPPDLCVIAGQNVTLNVSARDGVGPNTTPTNVVLTAFSGILPPATFRQTSTGTAVTGTFSWNTECSNVANQPYLVVFRAQDTPANAATAPLVDIKPVRITVVGPPPQNLRVVQTAAGGITDVVSWDKYTCQNASQILIYRKENPSGFNPGPCETGIPPSAGYTQVGSVPVTATTYADNQGLVRGKTYCYRIYAAFPLPAGGASIASAEACVTSSGRSAMLTNVDVNTTDPATGQITVKWTQPKISTGAFVSPTYTLSRAVATGATAGTFNQVVIIKNLTDTVYVDRGLNTTDNQYVYQLVFSNTPTAGAPAVEETAPTATSVRTSLVPDGINKTITVNWAYNVPWDNSKQPTRIYRKDPGSTTFSQVATATPGATSGTYLDKGLVAGQQYCYYVQTTGQYAGFSFLSNLLNKSQQICTTLLDVPCTPVLSLQVTNCDSLAALPSYLPVNQTYQNRLRWTTGTLPAGCATNAVRYRVFRSETEGGLYVLIDSTTALTYLDRNQPRPTYCYKVQAVAANGQRSALSNSACQSDCVFFILPNIFTPNGDNVNDVFRPKVSSPLVRTHIQIFNRWGRKVYEGSQDPYINWTGGGTAGESGTSGLTSGGIYYYLAEVEFADAAQTKRTFKGWVELVR
jgi:gliding motility-associated-like protein